MSYPYLDTVIESTPGPCSFSRLAQLGLDPNKYPVTAILIANTCIKGPITAEAAVRHWFRLLNEVADPLAQKYLPDQPAEFVLAVDRELSASCNRDYEVGLSDPFAFLLMAQRCNCLCGSMFAYALAEMYNIGDKFAFVLIPEHIYLIYQYGPVSYLEYESTRAYEDTRLTEWRPDPTDSIEGVYFLTPAKILVAIFYTTITNSEKNLLQSYEYYSGVFDNIPFLNEIIKQGQLNRKLRELDISDAEDEEIENDTKTLATNFHNFVLEQNHPLSKDMNLLEIMTKIISAMGFIYSFLFETDQYQLLQSKQYKGNLSNFNILGIARPMQDYLLEYSTTSDGRTLVIKSWNLTNREIHIKIKIGSPSEYRSYPYDPGSKVSDVVVSPEIVLKPRDSDEFDIHRLNLPENLFSTEFYRQYAVTIPSDDSQTLWQVMTLRKYYSVNDRNIPVYCE